MTLEKATKDMQALVAQHGFNYEGELTYDGRQIFTRRWTKKTQVVWYGAGDQDQHELRHPAGQDRPRRQTRRQAP